MQRTFLLSLAALILSSAVNINAALAANEGAKAAPEIKQAGVSKSAKKWQAEEWLSNRTSPLLLPGEAVKQKAQHKGPVRSFAKAVAKGTAKELKTSMRNMSEEMVFVFSAQDIDPFKKSAPINKPAIVLKFNLVDGSSCYLRRFPDGSYIIEDDFDSYFSYSGAQIPTLKALDTDDRVIYVSTLWQILYPLTTASFIVAPPSLIPVLLRGKALSEGVAEAMLQTTLAEILNSGYLQTHTKKWNNTFAARRRSALFQLKKAFGAAIETQNDCGGLNMLLRLPGIAPQLK